jgi:GDP/UDP-N,N'-diacetylbacillosamine 2-epimerase (hydrolysing)
MKIFYITGTRADFGLMKSTLRLMNASPKLNLGIIATGMHLSDRYGLTVNEIESEKFNVIAKVPCNYTSDSGVQMVKNLSLMLTSFVNIFYQKKPDVIAVLGDRGEMLSATLAAIHLNIPVVHIHGGERSGTIDESIRHAISKLAHYHLVATDESESRLIRMGEKHSNIHVVGAPGLDGLTSLATFNRNTLCMAEGLDPNKKIALLVFHPVLQESEHAGLDLNVIAETLINLNYQVIALMPNSDVGSSAIEQVLNRYAKKELFIVKKHLQRELFISWMASVDLMIGNSSSGIIEAASFGTPVINVGNRQNLRQRNRNVYDVSLDGTELSGAIHQIEKGFRREGYVENIYGDGKAGEKILDFFIHLKLDNSVLAKYNSY